MQTATARAEHNLDAVEVVAGHSAGKDVRSALTRAVPAESTVLFRIGFGLLITYSSLRFLARGWVDRLYIDPAHHLSYAGFDWVRPLPAPWMHLVVIGFAVLGLCIAAGWHYRVATVLFVVGFVYAELIEATLYLNHYWYMTLAGVLVCVLPLHHHWSLDARAGRVVASPLVPLAVVWVLRAQLAVVYVFAGLAKLNADWLFEAQPMRIWLADRTDLVLVGPLLDDPMTAYVASWAGALFDCTIVLWLLWPRTRRFAYIAVIVFHLSTAALFQIGVFPWVMMVSTLVFFEPDWPSALAARFGRVAPTASLSAGPSPGLSRATTAFLGLFALVQVALPLRHHLYDGNVRWTEEGYYLSWRVMLTEKSGFMEFEVTDPASGTVYSVDPSLVLEDWQIREASIRPDLIHATALLIADEYRERGIADVEVRADAYVSMNGAGAQRIVDPTVDLAAVPRRPR